MPVELGLPPLTSLFDAADIGGTLTLRVVEADSKTLLEARNMKSSAKRNVESKCMV